MKGPHPARLIILGVVIFALWAVVVTTQIETNEAYVAGTSAIDVYKPNWSIFVQVPQLILGQQSSAEAIQTIVGWGTELLFLIFVSVGYEVALSHVSHGGQILAAVFGLGSIVIVGYNLYTDYLYGSVGSGIGGHILFSVITAFIAAFFGILGPALIITGWKKL